MNTESHICFFFLQPLDMDLEMHSRLPPSAIDRKALDIPGKKKDMSGFLNIDRL